MHINSIQYTDWNVGKTQAENGENPTRQWEKPKEEQILGFHRKHSCWQNHRNNVSFLMIANFNI